MPYDPKKDPSTPYGPNTNGGALTAQGKTEFEITPHATDDLDPYVKAIEVTHSLGGQVDIVYLPVNNGDLAIVTKRVFDGWVSKCMVRRVISLTPVGGGTAKVYGIGM